MDVDYGINSNINYTISDTTLPGTFKLEDTDLGDGSMKVVNTKLIDLESVDGFVFDLEIKATETEGCEGECLSAGTNCTIQIEDINDNTPHFNQSEYEASVKENIAVNDYLQFETQINVTDKDRSPDYQQIVLSFQNEYYNDFFGIIPTTPVYGSGTILLMSRDNSILDYEESESKIVELVLVATDKNNDTYTDSTTIKINIEDVNDNPPEFTETNYQVSVSEDLSDIGADNVLIQVNVTDKDQTEAFGAKSVRFSLKNCVNVDCGDVEINDETGDVIISPDNNPLDADTDTGGHTQVMINKKKIHLNHFKLLKIT